MFSIIFQTALYCNKNYLQSMNNCVCVCSVHIIMVYSALYINVVCMYSVCSDHQSCTHKPLWTKMKCSQCSCCLCR